MTLLVLIAVIALAGVAQAVSGFGFALVAAPALVALTEPEEAVTVVTVLGVLVNLLTLARTRGRPQILRADAIALAAWAAPGVVAGAIVLTRLPEDAIRVAVGTLVLATLVQRRFVTAPRAVKPRWANPAGGLAAGALTTTTTLNGPPLVLALTAGRARATAVRDTLALLFVVLGAGGLVALAVAGALALPDGAAALLPAAVAGGLAGHALHDRMTEAARARAVTAMLVVSAVAAIASALR